MIQTPWFFWVLFNAAVLLLLVADLVIVNRRTRTLSIRQALRQSAFWVGLAAAFNVLVYWWHGRQAALEFLTGYVVEESLSVDNLFVFLLIFAYFRVPTHYQRKVLFWGILGALVMRATCIFAGVALIHRFHWIMYVFGAFLIFTGIKLAVEKDAEIEPERNLVLRLTRRMLPVTRDYDDDRFFVRRAGRLMATPLFVVVLVVESTDVMFALDSIPAILAITTDPFIVYTSNVFAILGLRALFFALRGLMELFHHLHYGLAVILVFIGVKMIIAEWVEVPIGLALGIVALVLLLSIAASLIWKKPDK